jgi:structural maintenance of chromosome 2
MYETKKILARKTVEKRQSSFNDIDRIINLEISPTVAKLQEELVRFRQWHALSHEVVKLDRYLIGYDYCRLFDILDPGKISTLQDRLTKLSTQSEQVKREQADAGKKLEAMATANNAESLVPFQEEEKTRKAEVHQSENQLRNKEKLADNLLTKLARYNKELEKARAQITKKRPEAEEAEARAIEAKEEVERLEESMEAIATGHSTGAEPRISREIKMLQEPIDAAKSSELEERLRLQGLDERLKNSASASKSAERE